MDDDEDGEDDNMIMLSMKKMKINMNISQSLGFILTSPFSCLCAPFGALRLCEPHNTQYSGGAPERDRRAEVGHGEAYCKVGLMMLARRQQLGDIREDLGFQSVLRLS